MRKGFYAVMAVVAGACVFSAACDDETTTGTTTGATTGTTTGSSTGSSTGATTGTPSGTGSGGPNCDELCTDLYGCTQEGSLCPGLADTSEEDFKNGSGGGSTGCLDTCAANPALAAVVNPDDCATTVTTLKGLNPLFKDSCEGSGGGGGAGGAAGGAGGN